MAILVLFRQIVYGKLIFYCGKIVKECGLSGKFDFIDLLWFNSDVLDLDETKTVFDCLVDFRFRMIPSNKENSYMKNREGGSSTLLSAAKAVQLVYQAKRKFPEAVRFLSNRIADGLEFDPLIGTPVPELPAQEILIQWERSKFLYLHNGVQMLEPEVLKCLRDNPMSREISAAPPSGKPQKKFTTDPQTGEKVKKVYGKSNARGGRKQSEHRQEAAAKPSIDVN